MSGAWKDILSSYYGNSKFYSKAMISKYSIFVKFTNDMWKSKIFIFVKFNSFFHKSSKICYGKFSRCQFSVTIKVSNQTYIKSYKEEEDLMIS